MSAVATVSVTSLKDHPYDGIVRPAGTVYEAGAPYVEPLILLGLVSVVEPGEPISDAPKPDAAQKRGTRR